MFEALNNRTLWCKDTSFNVWKLGYWRGDHYPGLGWVIALCENETSMEMAMWTGFFQTLDLSWLSKSVAEEIAGFLAGEPTLTLSVLLEANRIRIFCHVVELQLSLID